MELCVPVFTACIFIGGVHIRATDSNVLRKHWIGCDAYVLFVQLKISDSDKRHKYCMHITCVICRIKYLLKYIAMEEQRGL